LLTTSLRHSWQFIETVENGGELHVTFALGDPEPARPGLSVGTPGQPGGAPLSLDMRCDHIQPSVDAVLPAQVLVNNPSAQVLPGGYSFDFRGEIAVDAVDIGDGASPACKVGLNATEELMDWTHGVPAGSGLASNMFFVIHGFYAKSAAQRQALLDANTVLFSYADGTTAGGSDVLLTPGDLIGPDVNYDGSVPLSG